MAIVNWFKKDENYTMRVTLTTTGLLPLIAGQYNYIKHQMYSLRQDYTIQVIS
jgi:hypothetical protein